MFDKVKGRTELKLAISIPATKKGNKSHRNQKQISPRLKDATSRNRRSATCGSDDLRQRQLQSPERTTRIEAGDFNPYAKTRKQISQKSKTNIAASERRNFP